MFGGCAGMQRAACAHLEFLQVVKLPADGEQRDADDDVEESPAVFAPPCEGGATRRPSIPSLRGTQLVLEG